MSSYKFRLLLVCSVLIAAGCSTNVVVKGTYPIPLKQDLPMSAALYFSPDFQQYTFSDESGNRDVSINFGSAQMALYTTVSQGMFRNSQVIESIPSGNPVSGIDLIIAPNVEEVQVALPYDTQLNVYEVWIKYNLQVFNAAGEPIADWIMTSYGKTPTRTLKSASEALNQASNVALRDAGARIATSFTKVPEISDWLQSRQRPANALTADKGGTQ